MQKPARYIGCEDGAVSPRPRPRQGGLAARLPRHLRDRPAQPGPADPLRDPQRARRRRGRAVLRAVDRPRGACCGAHGLPLFSVDTHRPAGEFDVSPSTCRPSSSTRTSSTASTWPACPCGRPTAGPSTRWSAPAATAPTTPSRSPTSSTSSCSATARRSSARSPRSCGEWKASRPHRGQPRARAARAGRDPGRVRAVDVRRRLRRRRPRGRHARATPTCPAQVEKRTVADLADWPYPKQPARAAHRGGARPAQRRGVPGLHPGLPVLPGRDDHPPGARAPGRAGAHDGRSEGLRRTGYDEVALTSLSTADFSRHRAAWSPTPSTTRPAAATCQCQPAVSLRVDAFTVGIAAQIQKARRTGLTFAPEAGTWRMRQVINKLIPRRTSTARSTSAYSPGLAADEAVLPHRAADRDRRGHPRHRRAGPQLRRRSASGTPTGPRSRCRVGGFVPKPFTRRSSGSARTPSSELQPQGRPAARRHPPRPRACSSSGTTRRRRVVEGLASRGDRRLGPVIERGLARRRHVPGVERALRPRPLGGGHGRRRASTSTGTCYRHRTEDEVLPWDHLSAGLHKDFLWQDWRDALAELGLEDCRWTPCYDCGACTGYGIEHVVASAVPPAGGSQGTGQDLRRRRRGAGAAAAASTSRSGRRRRDDAGSASASPSSARSASPATATWPASGSGRCAGPSCRVAYTEGFSPRPRLQLRAGPVHRPRVARRVPRHRPAPSRRSTPSTTLPRAARRRALPRRHRRSQAAAVARPAATVAAAGGHQLLLADRARRRRRRRRGRRGRRRAAGRRRRSPSPASARAQSRHRRPAARHPRPASVGHATVGHARAPSWPPNPAACAPRSCSRALPEPRPSASPRPGAAHPPMDRRVDGARREPLPSARRRATSAPHAGSVRHEKGTHP